MKKLCAQLLAVVGATPRGRKYLFAALGIGVAASVIGMLLASMEHASFVAYVLTN